MGRTEYLIDTNVAIDYIGGALPSKALDMLDDIIDEQFYLSVINKIELLGFEGISENEEIHFQKLINAAVIYDLDEDIVNRTIELRRVSKTKLPDAIIAATALVNKLTIITRNTKDFLRIKGLKVLNPYSS